ncbi:hypothetical protein GQ53DRAFT_837064 [Thozetella sp. PMI_491]|nr:hypothetical protein GQ53DRAFT_837064 [Thozetella sp. PMI_491]
MRAFTVAAALGCVLNQFVAQVAAKAVFAHYMVGTITEDHAHKDIDDAMALGLDGFALNIGDPGQQFVTDALGYLFGYANYRGFKLFISMDLAASGGDPNAFNDIFKGALGWDCYYRAGPNNYPLVSTFDSAGRTNVDITNWLAVWADIIFFVPDFDDTAGYYDAADGWWAYWGNVVDGLFSWESTWPAPGATNGGDTSLDEKVMAGAKAHNKFYMMGLSMLQYKNAYGGAWFRKGDLNLPKRMEKILTIQPDFVEIITWNDGPESHYIGNVWPEANGDKHAAIYASMAGADHSAIQPLLKSWIAAYKSGASAASMLPPGSAPVGALWHKTIFQDTTCPGAGSGVAYFEKPAYFDVGTDSLNWAVVVPAGATGWTARLVSAGNAIQTVNLNPGFNYGSWTAGVAEGTQRLLVRDASGATVAATDRGRCMSHTCHDAIYNMNFQINGLKPAGSYNSNECWQVSGTAVIDWSTNTVTGISQGP